MQNKYEPNFTKECSNRLIKDKGLEIQVLMEHSSSPSGSNKKIILRDACE